MWISHKSLNCFQTSGASETKNVEGYAREEERGGGDYLFRYVHQIRLKSFQGTIQFWMLVFYKGDTENILLEMINLMYITLN